MKHFEDLWNECEKFCIENDVRELNIDLNYVQENLAENRIGQILLLLTKLSAKHNINVYAALQEALQEEKQKFLDSQEE